MEEYGLAASFYTPETIRAEIYQRNQNIYTRYDMQQYPDLPENVEMYTDLVPLETFAPLSIATSFRATHRQSGGHVALRRLQSFTGSQRLEQWKMINHPNIVRLIDYFFTRAFGDYSMILVYEYSAASVTLMHKFLAGGGGLSADPGFHEPFSSDPDAPRPYTHQMASGALLPEAALWSILVQLTTALRAIHGAGLACRSLDQTKVIMNSCRVRIAWCGAAELLHNNTNDVAQAQQDDLTQLGRITLSLAIRSVHVDNLPACMDLVARAYSADLTNIIQYMLSTSTRRSVFYLLPMIGDRVFTQVEALERRADVLEDLMAREMDNGRLLRILTKLAVINERPELAGDPAWSTRGDRFMLKLYRDNVFHSVTPDGRPWLDQKFLVECLKNLDAGTRRRVWLTCREEHTRFMVSYFDLKRCLDQAFEEVMQAAGPS